MPTGKSVFGRVEKSARSRGVSVSDGAFRRGAQMGVPGNLLRDFSRIFAMPSSACPHWLVGFFGRCLKRRLPVGNRAKLPDSPAAVSPNKTRAHVATATNGGKAGAAGASQNTCRFLHRSGLRGLGFGRLKTEILNGFGEAGAGLCAFFVRAREGALRRRPFFLLS